MYFIDVYQFFIDFKQEHDKINKRKPLSHEASFNIIQNLLVSLVKANMEKPKCQVKFARKLSHAFDIT